MGAPGSHEMPHRDHKHTKNQPGLTPTISPDLVTPLSVDVCEPERLRKGGQARGPGQKN